MVALKSGHGFEAVRAIQQYREGDTEEQSEITEKLLSGACNSPYVLKT
jgi:hypothetical protein